MKIVTSSNRTFEIEEVNKLLHEFEFEATILNISRMCANAYAKDYSHFLNLIQLIPGCLNSVGMFCKGMRRDFSPEHFDLLCAMTGSLNIHTPGSRGPIDEMFKVSIRAFRQSENVHFVFGRLVYVFDWIKKNNPALSFNMVVGVRLEDFLVVFFGAYALGTSGVLSAYDPNHLFKDSNFSPERIVAITEVIEKEVSISLAEFRQKTLDYLVEHSKVFEDTYTAFEDKPFLRINGIFVLVAPHFGVNEMVSVAARLYTAKYSSEKQNDASQAYGFGFEDYICTLLESVLAPHSVRDPFYKGTTNKGVDMVRVVDALPPLIVEIQKAVVYRSVNHSFSINNFENFIKKEIVKKFNQMFSWLSSHQMNYNEVDLTERVHDIKFVLCMSQSVPLLEFDEPSKKFIEWINECWQKRFPGMPTLKQRNLFVLGAYETELMVGVAEGTGQDVWEILNGYVTYRDSYPDAWLEVFNRGEKVIHTRKSFLSWLMDNYDCKRYRPSLTMKLGVDALNRLQEGLKK